MYVSLLAVLTVSGVAVTVLKYRDIVNHFSFFRRSQSLNPDSFTTFTLTAKDSISAHNVIFTLTGPRSEQLHKDVQPLESTILSIEIKQPQLQIARAYTPLPSLTVDESESSSSLVQKSSLRFLIKKEEKGEVSKYLHTLPIGSQVEVRGPKIEFRLPNHLQEVLFIAGGTGIAPALQIAKILHDQSSAKLHILWANRKENDLTGNYSDFPEASRNKISGIKNWNNPVVEQLENLKDQWRHEKNKALVIEYYVDENNQYISNSDVKKHTVCDARGSQTGGTRLILVSGPEGFINHWAGPKVWQNGEETQGQLGGLLGKLNLDKWQIWKL